MTDTPEMMTREEIEDLNYWGEYTASQFERLCDTALLAVTQLPKLQFELDNAHKRAASNVRELEWRYKRIATLEAENNRLIGELRAAKESK